NADGLHQPVGRNGGHPGGAAGGEAEGVAEPGDLQRERLDDYAGGRGDDTDACGAGDWRGIDESVYGAACGAAAAGVVSWAGAGEAGTGRGAEADAGVHADSAQDGNDSAGGRDGIFRDPGAAILPAVGFPLSGPR